MRRDPPAKLRLEADYLSRGFLGAVAFAADWLAGLVGYRLVLTREVYVVPGAKGWATAGKGRASFYFERA